VKIDKLDLKLILELEKNSRQSLSKISKKIKNSQQLVSYRLNKLIEEKIILNFITIIDYYKLGFKNHKIYLKLNTNSENLEKIISYLKDKKYINYICECCNNYDLIIEFISKNTYDFNNKFTAFRNLFYKNFKNYLILETFEKYYYYKDYLNNKFRNLNLEKSTFLDSKRLILKNKDIKILEILTNNSRISTVDICNELNIDTVYFVKSINKFKNNGIILKQSMFLDFNKLNIEKYKLLIKFKDLSIENSRNIILYLKNNLNVIDISKVIGCFDLEISFEVKSKTEFLYNITEIKNKFYKNIDNLEVITIFYEQKYFY
jgi:Lrp/AsnC family leucine-responsive transcriptional regulator